VTPGNTPAGSIGTRVALRRAPQGQFDSATTGTITATGAHPNKNAARNPGSQFLEREVETKETMKVARAAGRHPLVFLSGKQRKCRTWTFGLFPGAIVRNSFAAFLVLVCTGCVAVAPNEQRLVSKPNMVFSESAVFGYDNKLLSQMEPGSAFSGGCQSSGCTSCK
jgi:hypothetical protein